MTGLDKNALALCDFQLLFEGSPHPYLVLSPDTSFTILAVNDRYLAATGTQRAAIIGHRLFDIFPDNPNDSATRSVNDLRISLDRVLRDRIQDIMGVQKYDIPDHDTVGQFIVKYWSPVNSPVFTAEGTITAIIHHVEDVTDFVLARERTDQENSKQLERMEAEILLRAGEVKQANRQIKATMEQLERSNEALNATFYSILANLSDSVATIDEKGVIQMVNPAFERLFGLKSAEVVGGDFQALIPGSLQSGDELDQGYREATALHKDGGKIAVDLSISEMTVGERRLFIGVIRDNSARKAAEQALRESETRLRLITNSLPILIFQTDGDGRLLFTNNIYEQWFGPSEHPPRLARDAFGPSLAGQWDRVREQLPMGETIFFVGDIIDRDGLPRDIRLTIVPQLGGEGAIIGFFGLMEDTTKLNTTLAQLQQAQKMEAVGQLTGGLAHDFNNLLGIIIGNLDLLEGAFDHDPPKAAMMTAAINAALRGSDLTRSLLAFARRQPLNPTQTEVNDLLKRLVQLLRRTIGEQVEITFTGGEQLWPTSIDVAQLESAITNLAINARDAMPNGGRLFIATANTTLDEDYAGQNPGVTPGDYIRIEVSDTGSGIPPEVLAHVFEPFYTTKALGKGTGLGLSMVFGFMKQSGGHVKIYSEPGHGTTVRLYLRRRVGPIENKELAPSERPQGGHETVLVVEDNAELRQMAITQLTSLGYRTIEAEDGHHALEIIDSGAAFDILFSDIIMPNGMTGYDLAREARLRRPDLPILFTSGFPGTVALPPEQSQPHLKMDLLNKPYRKDDLALKLRQTLDRKGAAP